MTGTPLPDDIPITLQWEDSAFEVEEDTGSVVLTALFTTTLNAPPEADFTFEVTLTTTSSSANEDDDYTPPATSANFVAGDFIQTDVNGEQRYRATRNFTVANLDDTEDESDEVIQVTMDYLTPGLSHLRGGPQSATVTIKDNDHVPVSIGWERSDVTINEGATSVRLMAIATTTKDKIPDEGFSMDVSVGTMDGTAVQPSDYTQFTETVTFGRSDFRRATIRGIRTYKAAKQIDVVIVNDTDDEPDESFGLTVDYADPGAPHLLGGAAFAKVTIIDDDHVPVTIVWEQTTFNVNEDAGTVVLRAVSDTTKDKMPESGLSFGVSVATTDDTATQGEDYQRISTNLSFRQRDFSREMVNGQYRYRATKDVNLRILDDSADEESESLDVSLDFANSAPHLQGGPDTATVLIADNDHVPVTLGWEQTALTADEVSGSIALRAVAITTKDKMPDSGFTFDARVSARNGSARAPSDYAHLDETVTFDRADFLATLVNGQRRYRAEKSFTVAIADDGTAEQSEQFTVSLAFITPGLPHLIRGDMTATVTIVDDLSSTVNLFVSAQVSRLLLTRDEEFTYSYSVSNSGPATSTRTVLEVTVEPGVTFVSATPAGWCSRSGSRLVNCNIGSLGQSVSDSGELVFQVGSSAGGDITITAEVDSDQVDSRPEDNASSEIIELDAAPERVTNLRANGGSSHIELSWRRPSDNCSPITGYELQRKEEDGNFLAISPAPSAAATTYRDNQVTVDRTYTYILRAVNGDGEAEWSNEASATVGEPPPPPEITGGGLGGLVIVPVNNDPEFSEGTRTTRMIDENSRQGTNVGEPVRATDEDGDSLTYSLRGVDAESFNVSAGTGQITVLADLDHEDRDTYLLRLDVSDGNGGDASIKVDVTVSDVDEPPELAGETAVEVAEGASGSAADFTAVDPEGAEVMWRLAGLDASAFKVEDGALSFATTTDYEAPADADADNVYTLSIAATDGNSTSTLQVAITVNDVNEPPALMGPVSVEAEENSVGPVALYSAADPEGAEVMWRLAGLDASAFKIEDGVLSFATTTDYETPADNGSDNVYVVSVAVTDGNSTTTLGVRASVTDVDEPPALSGPGSLEVAENEIGGFARYVAIDPEDAEVSWVLDGEDRDVFTLQEGTLSFASPPNFEAPLDFNADNVYRLVIQALDQNDNPANQLVQVSVLDIDGEDVVGLYDSDGDELIDRAEALSAVFDYFANVLTKEEAIEVVSYYFAN